MRVIVRIEIDAEPPFVFKWLADREKARQWMTSVSRAEMIAETPEMVGSTFREYVEEDGVGLEFFGRVTEYREDRCLAVHLESELNTVDVRFELTANDGGTEVTQSVDLRLRGIRKLLALLLGPRVRHKVLSQAAGDLSRLKSCCEAALASSS